MGSLCNEERARSRCSCCVLFLFIFLITGPSLTVVMAFKAVSAPMLRSEPGTLLETVAGTMTMGTQSSSYFPRAVNNSSSDRKACRAEPRALVSARLETVTAVWWGGATCHKEGKDISGRCQGEEPGLSQRAAAKQTGTTLHTLIIRPYRTHFLAYVTGKLKLVSI